MPTKRLNVTEVGRKRGAHPNEICLELNIGEKDGPQQISLPITLGNTRKAKVVDGGIEVITMEGAPIYLAIKALVNPDHF